MSTLNYLTKLHWLQTLAAIKQAHICYEIDVRPSEAPLTNKRGVTLAASIFDDDTRSIVLQEMMYSFDTNFTLDEKYHRIERCVKNYIKAANKAKRRKEAQND